MTFDESKHPRDSDGKFTDGNKSDYADGVNKRIRWAKNNGIKLPLNGDGSVDDMALQKLYDSREISNLPSASRLVRNYEEKFGDKKKMSPVKVNMDADIQKQFDNATTPKERQKLVFRYIMDNLRGQYSAPDGRTVAIERVGADKLTYQDNPIKLRVCPSLAEMIKTGQFQYIAKAEEKKHQRFKEFAYYKVALQVGDDLYEGLLNVGIRENGRSTLYDLKPLYKQ